MSDIVSDFLQAYFRYSVGQRAFEDICRQMVECVGDLEERQQLVDESCRLAIFVSDCSEELEEISIHLINELQDEEDRDDDFLNDVALSINQVIEDRARANSYTNQVTYLRIGGTPRKPRRPRVANPFIPIIVDDEQTPIDDYDNPTEGTITEGDPQYESLDPPTEDETIQPDEGKTSHFKRMAERFRRKKADEVINDVGPVDTPTEEEIILEDSEDGSEDDDSSNEGNPLAKESEHILSESKDDDTEEEEEESDGAKA